MDQFRFFDVKEEGTAVVAQIVDSHLQGEAMGELMKLELLRIAGELSPKMMIIAFEKVTIVSTNIVSSLIYVNQRLGGLGIPLRLCSMNGSLLHIFRTLQLDGSVFQILPTVEAAIATQDGPITYEDICGRPTPFDPEASD